MASKSSLFDSLKEENVPKFKNSWYASILLLFLTFDINVSAMRFFFNFFYEISKHILLLVKFIQHLFLGSL